MTLSPEDARALAYQQTLRRRAINVQTAVTNLRGDPAARLALMQAWEPILHHGDPYYPGQYNDFPVVAPVPPISID